MDLTKKMTNLKSFYIETNKLNDEIAFNLENTFLRFATMMNLYTTHLKEV